VGKWEDKSKGRRDGEEIKSSRNFLQVDEESLPH
jgi:hypothetical protein